MTIKKMTYAEWMTKGKALFGEELRTWRFVCPVCGHVQTANDFQVYKNRGATPDSVFTECLGRYLKKRCRAVKNGYGEIIQPCNYASYGLLNLCPIRVIDDKGNEVSAFAFDETDETTEVELKKVKLGPSE